MKDLSRSTGQATIPVVLMLTVPPDERELEKER